MISIILAAGQGKRLRPLTYYIPKVLMPVYGKPILNHIMEKIYSLGIEENYVVVSEFYDIVKKYIEKTDMKNINVIKGLGWETEGDLSLALEEIGKDDDYLVMNGDMVTDINLNDLLNFHKNNNGYLTMTVIKVKDESTERYGSITMDFDGKIIKFSEKKDSNAEYINAGIYIFDRKLIEKRYEYLKIKKVKLEEDLFPRLANEGLVYGFLAKYSYFFDVGTIESYKKALKHFCGGENDP